MNKSDASGKHEVFCIGKQGGKTSGMDCIRERVPKWFGKKRETEYDWSMGLMNSVNLMGDSRCFPGFCSLFGNYFKVRFIFIKAD